MGCGWTWTTSRRGQASVYLGRRAPQASAGRRGRRGGNVTSSALRMTSFSVQDRQRGVQRMRGVTKLTVVLGSLIVLGLCSCATIPKEAPQLSIELGKRLSAIEESHLRLLDAYFGEKRAAVDRYIDQVWIPKLSAELMQEPTVSTMWSQVCQEGTDRDRVEFLRRLGPKLQRSINVQRLSMIEPLDELQRTVANHLHGEYAQAQSINGTLTSFLASASDVSDNQKRLMEMLGVHDERVDAVITDVDSIVVVLAEGVDKVEASVQKADHFKQQVRASLARARESLARK